MNLYLFMAVFWLVLGLALVIVPGVNPKALPWAMLGGRISVGWLALVLALYNVLRWWLLRSAAQRRAREEDRQPVRSALSASPPPAPDPNFQFTDPPPEPK